MGQFKNKTILGWSLLGGVMILLVLVFVMFLRQKESYFAKDNNRMVAGAIFEASEEKVLKGTPTVVKVSYPLKIKDCESAYMTFNDGWPACNVSFSLSFAHYSNPKTDMPTVRDAVFLLGRTSEGTILPFGCSRDEIKTEEIAGYQFGICKPHNVKRTTSGYTDYAILVLKQIEKQEPPSKETFLNGANTLLNRFGSQTEYYLTLQE